MAGSFLERQAVDELIHRQLLAGVRPQTAPVSNHSPKFIWPSRYGDMRVKFELGEERSIMMISRPVSIDSLNEMVQRRFGRKFMMYFYNMESKGFQPLCSQSDLDHAMALHDAHPECTCLKIVLTYESPTVPSPASPPSFCPAAPDPQHSPSLSPTPDNLKDQIQRYTQRSASEPHRPGQVEEGFRESPDWFASYPGHPPARILERDESPPPGFIDVEPTPSVPPDILGQEGGKFIPESDGESEPDHASRSIPSSPSDFSYLSSENLSTSGGDMVGRHGYPMYDDDHSYFVEQESLTRTYPRERAFTDDIIHMKKALYGTHPLNPPKLPPSHYHYPFRKQKQFLSTASSSPGGSILYVGGFGEGMGPKRPSDSELPLQKLAAISVQGKVTVPLRWSKGKLLGTGAFGQVFMCTDLDTDRDLAVKVVDIDHIDRGKPSGDSLHMQKEVRSFETEVQLLKNLRHERIVTYHGTERKDGKLYIFMEHMSGVKLKSAIISYR